MLTLNAPGDMVRLEREEHHMMTARFARALALALGVYLLGACGGSAPSSSGSADFVVSALVASDVAELEVTVTSGAFSVTRLLNFNAATNSWSGLIGGIPAGPARFSAVARDAGGTILAQTAAPVTANVPSGGVVDVHLVLQGQAAAPFENSAPVLESVTLSPGEVSPGGAVSITATATDADGDPMSFSISSAGGGSFSVEANDPNGHFQATFTAPSAEGDVPVTLSVTDGRGATSKATFAIRVRVAPGRARVTVTISSAPDVLSMSGVSLPLEVGVATIFTAEVVDPQGSSLSYQWSVDCAGTLTGATAASATFTLTDPAATSCSVAVVVTNAAGAFNTGTLVVPVGAAFINRPPVITSVFQTALGALAGTPVTFEAVASDLDNDLLEANWTVSPVDADSVLGAGALVEAPGVPSSTWTASNTFTPGCAVATTYTVTVSIVDVLDPGGAPLGTPATFEFSVECTP
jgi:hypothetical protein